jgi:hypothetical protein
MVTIYLTKPAVSQLLETGTCDIFNAKLSPDLPIAEATMTHGISAINRVIPLLTQGRTFQLINPSQIICPTIVATIEELCPESNNANANTVPAAGARVVDKS